MKNTIIKVLSVVMAMVMAFGACLVVGASDFNSRNECTHANCTEYTTVDATCFTWGYTVYQCSDCKELFTKNNEDEVFAPCIAKDGFELIVIETVASTCVEYGYTKAKCSICGTTHTNNETTLAAHKWGNWTVTDKATCTDVAIEEHTCRVCGKTEAKEGQDAIGHNYLPVEAEMIAPTCYSEGMMPFVCEDCGDRQEVVIERVDHKYFAVTEYIAASCTTDGYTVGDYCEWCNYTTNGKYTPASHDWDLANTEFPYKKVDATCTDKGYIEGYCKVCAAYAKVELAPIPHNFQWATSSKSWKEPTCTDKGAYVYACVDCQHISDIVEVPALGHEFWLTEYKEATCTTPAGYLYTCINGCGEEKFEADVYQPAYGHSPYINETLTPTIDAVAPTCQNKGNTEGYYCYYCGEAVYTVLEKTPCVYKVGSCATNGVRGQYCIVCGGTKNVETYTATAGTHAYYETAIIPATCAGDGSITWECAFCGDTYIEVAPQLAHREKEVYVDATCSSYGMYVVICERANCPDMLANGYLRVTEKDLNAPPVAANHVWSEDPIEVVLPSCTVDGYVVYECTEPGCDATNKVVIKAAGHQVVVAPRVEPTCTEDGLTEGKVCAACGLYFLEQHGVEADVTLAAKGHKWEMIYKIVPGCTTYGYVTYRKCADCKTIEYKTIDNNNKVVWVELDKANAATDWEANIVIPMTTGNVTLSTDPATCYGGKIGYSLTTTCGNVYCAAHATVSNFQYVPAHTWDNVEHVQEVGCESDGYIYNICTVCEAAGIETRNIVRMTDISKGHHDKDGNVIPVDCTRGEIANVHCEHCGLDIDDDYILANGHKNVSSFTEERTCTSYEKEVYVCNDCKLTIGVVYNYEAGLAEHNFVEYRDVTDGVATFEKAVWVEAECADCGKDGSYWDTKGVEVIVEVVNGAGKKLDFVNGSKKVQVKISLRGDKVDLNNFFLSFEYNKNAFNYVDAQFNGKITGATNDFEAYNDKDNGKVNLVFFVSNIEEGKVRDITLTGEAEWVATLNFEVKSTFHATEDSNKKLQVKGTNVKSDAKLAIIETATVISNSNGAELREDLGKEIEITANTALLTIYKVGDSTKDGKINNLDGVKMLDLMTKNEITAQCDVDFDYQVTPADFAILRGWIVGSIQYTKTTK